MNKEQFIELLREIGGQMPDISVRKEFLQNKFSEYGFSIETGYKVVNHYYDELKKGFAGIESIYKGTFIINKESNFVYYSSGNYGYTVSMKFITEGFYRLEQVFNYTPETSNKFKALHEKLINKFFIDISINDFDEIMNFKHLPNGKNKVQWINRNNAEAYRFSKQFNFTIKQMNDCFSFPDGKLQHNDKPKESRTQSELTKIFKELNL